MFFALRWLVCLIWYNSDMRTTTRLIFFGQLSLLGFLLICTILMPHFLFESNEGGVSNYGVHARTIIPYSLAFGLSGLFTIRAAWTLPKTIKSYQRLRLAVVALGILYLCTLASTYLYQLNGLVDEVHQLAGTALFLLELLLGGWFIVALKRDAVNCGLYIVQCIGFTLAALTYAGAIHILFIAEILPAIAFAAILVRTIAQLETTTARTD